MILCGNSIGSLLERKYIPVHGIDCCQKKAPTNLDFLIGIVKLRSKDDGK